jgi:uncharacterized protein (TIGR00290 family)
MSESAQAARPRPKAWMAWSSGKDSAWALHTVRQSGDYDVTGLLTTITETFDRVSMHGVRRSIVEAQARSVGIPLITAPIPFPCPNETYEKVMAAAMARARAEGVRVVIFGDLYLEDVRAYREKTLSPVGMTPVFPLWGRPTHELAEQMIDDGLHAIVVCIDPRRLSRTLAGSRFDRMFLDALPPGIDPCAENGEFHTVVVGGPMFKTPIPVKISETVEREGFVYTDVIPE